MSDQPQKQSGKEARKRCPDQAKAFERPETNKPASKTSIVAAVAWANGQAKQKSIANNHPDYPSPTPQDLDDPQFRAIWDVIKSWDINVPEWYNGHTGAMGNHAAAIVLALRKLSHVQPVTRKAK